MSSPLDLANIGIGSTSGGTLLSAFGAGFSGFGKASMYGYQAGIERAKAAIAKQNANYAFQQGDIQGEQYGIKGAQEAGRIRAAQGASNLDVDSGSNALVQESQHRVQLMDIQQIRANAAQVAYGYKTEAAIDEAKAGMYDTAKRNTMIATPFNIASSLISGSTSVADKWLQGKSVGLYSADSSPDTIDQDVYG